MNIRKTIRHIFGLDLFGVPSPRPSSNERGYREASSTSSTPSELDRLRKENERLALESKNLRAHWDFERNRADAAVAALHKNTDTTPYRKRIESLRQALADIMTGNANPGTMVPDAYMRCAHEALQADDKVAKDPSKQPAPPPPSWTSGTPVSWGKR